MEVSKRKALEAAGWKFGDTADFLDLNAGERRLLDARVKLAPTIREPLTKVLPTDRPDGDRERPAEPASAQK